MMAAVHHEMNFDDELIIGSFFSRTDTVDSPYVAKHAVDGAHLELSTILSPHGRSGLSSMSSAIAVSILLQAPRLQGIPFSQWL